MIVVQAREPDRGKLLFNGSVGSLNTSWDRRVISTRTVGDEKPSRSDHSIESVSYRNTRKEPLIYPSMAVPCCAPRSIIWSHIPLPLLGGGPGPRERQRGLLRTTGTVCPSLDHDWVVVGMPNSFWQ